MMSFCKLAAQAWSFENYNVDRGLSQSQVTAICQDADDNIWVSTMGGVSCFDGTVFRNYTESEGLANNYTTSLMNDNRRNIWIGTQNGLSAFNGSVFTNYYFSKEPLGNYVTAALQDSTGRIWVLTARHLYSLYGNHFRLVPMPGTADASQATLVLGKRKRLWLYAPKTGMYTYDQGMWNLRITRPRTSTLPIADCIINNLNDTGEFYLLSARSLYRTKAGIILRDTTFSRLHAHLFNTLFQDSDSSLWVSTSTSLYRQSSKAFMFFGEKDGFTNLKTTVVFQDREKNVWCGTNGLGLYRLSQEAFAPSGNFNGTGNRLAVAMLQGADRRLYVATDGSGLFVHEAATFKHFGIPSINELDQHIMGLAPYTPSSLLVWTEAGHVWTFTKNAFRRVALPGYADCVNAAAADGQKGFWLAGCNGCYHYSMGIATRLVPEFCYKIISLSEDSILVASRAGLYVIGHQRQVVKVNDPLLNRAYIHSALDLGSQILFATGNMGLLLYNKKARTTCQWSVADGLNSNYVYSMVRDKTGAVWVGTGKGIGKIILDARQGISQIINYAARGEHCSAECDQDAAVCDLQGTLWFGTSLGLLRYTSPSTALPQRVPPVVLTDVKLSGKSIMPRYAGGFFQWNPIPRRLVLPNNQNNLSFSFGCASFRWNDRIRYQYRLRGVQPQFSEFVSERSVNYSALPAGSYVFEVRASLTGIPYTSPIASFPFRINKAWYEKRWVEWAALLLFILSILLLQWLVLRHRKKRLELIESVKAAEHIRLRVRTAEDFHDDIGNHLGRLLVLSELLRRKLSGTDTESISIIDQIKENAGILYQATRDVIWSLDPSSDKITSVTYRLSETALTLFDRTSVKCTVDNKVHGSEMRTLSTDQSRNLVMIFKEAMSNVLKHSNASEALLKMELTAEDDLSVILTDNGEGYDTNATSAGNGIGNMQTRARRISAHLFITSVIGQGTVYHLTLSITANRRPAI